MANVAIPLLQDPDDADLKAIWNYVQDQRPLIPKFPGLQAKIEDFEKWYQGLTWYNLDVMIDDTIAEAMRRRDEINVLEHDTLDPTWVPADKVGKAPGTTAGPGQKPPWLPKWVLPTAVISGAVTLVLVVVRKIAIP